MIGSNHKRRVYLTKTQVLYCMCNNVTRALLTHPHTPLQQGFSLWVFSIFISKYLHKTFNWCWFTSLNSKSLHCREDGQSATFNFIVIIDQPGSTIVLYKNWLRQYYKLHWSAFNEIIALHSINQCSNFVMFIIMLVIIQRYWDRACVSVECILRKTLKLMFLKLQKK